MDSNLDHCPSCPSYFVHETVQTRTLEVACLWSFRGRALAVSRVTMYQVAREQSLYWYRYFFRGFCLCF
jgi:hypothetical protein